jgi:hypothetical protein
MPWYRWCISLQLQILLHVASASLWKVKSLQRCQKQKKLKARACSKTFDRTHIATRMQFAIFFSFECPWLMLEPDIIHMYMYIYMYVFSHHVSVYIIYILIVISCVCKYVYIYMQWCLIQIPQNCWHVNHPVGICDTCRHAMSLAALLSTAAWPAAVSVCLLERLGYPMWLGKDPNQDVFFCTSCKSGKHPKWLFGSSFFGLFPTIPPGYST